MYPQQTVGFLVECHRLEIADVSDTCTSHAFFVKEKSNLLNFIQIATACNTIHLALFIDGKGMIGMIKFGQYGKSSQV